MSETWPWNAANLGIAMILALTMIWAVYYTLTKALPTSIDKFIAMTGADRTAFTEQLAEERAVCERRHAENLKQWAANRERGDSAHSELMSAHRLLQVDNRDMRHAMANMANQVGLLAAVVKGVLKGKGVDLQLPDVKIPLYPEPPTEQD